MTRIDLSQIPVSGRFIKSVFIWCRFGLAALGIAAFGLAISAPAARSQGIPEDWADRHSVFSNPGSITDAVNSGSVEKWYKIVSNPRFMAQTRKRSSAATRAIHSGSSLEETRFLADRERDGNNGGRGGGRGTKPDEVSLKKDWSMNLGPAGKVSAGQFPAKFSFNANTAFCDIDTTPDFVVFPTGSKGATTTVSSIIAYDNIYKGCSGFTTGPLIYWSYDTDGGTIITSPVLSADGTQVAFIASGTAGSGTGAALVILKWKAPATKGTNATTLNLLNTAVASYRACVAPCLTDIALSGTTPADSISSPYYDYANDVLYVGDDTGTLHKFTNIFVSGTPAEITGGGAASGWPQTVSSGNKLTSPVYDVATGNVLAGTSAGTMVRIPGGGHLVGGGLSNLVTSGVLSLYATGISSAPIVDSQAGQVYVDVACDAINDCNGALGHSSNSAIYQLTTSFASGSTGTKQTFGHVTATNVPLFAGSFDNFYFNSVNNTGNLYVCGISSTHNNRPSLYQIPITNNVMGTPREGPEVATTGTTCSPVTEVLNGSTDLIFLSQANANRQTAPISCPSGTGCIMSFDVSSGAAITTSKATAATAFSPSGTSGIVIDNVVGVPAGTSEVYFTPLGNGTCTGNGTVGGPISGRGCAVQLSQAQLR